MTIDNPHSGTVHDVHDWFFACPQFVEPLLAEELTALGAEQVKTGYSGVQARGNLAFAYRVILWSRLASRATLQLAQGFGKNQAELQDLLATINWSAHIHPEGSFKVRFSGANDDIQHTGFGAQWVKDQIVDAFRSEHGVRPSVSPNPDLVVSVNLYSGKASVGIDLHLKGLHQRGYRDPDGFYPLHENLAAAVLIRAGWPALLAGDAPKLALVDPLCSSGTFLIEGALMALDIAPGLLRGATLATRWCGHDAALWASLLAEARERQAKALDKADRYLFRGYDTDEEALATARIDWDSTGLPAVLKLQNAALGQFTLTLPPDTAGLMITSPPFAEEETPMSVRPRYARLGQAVAGFPAGLQGALFAPAAAPLALTDLFYNKEYRFQNGRDDWQLWTLTRLAQKERPTAWGAEDFANRLRKNLRKLKPFIQRGHTDAYRIYDADIPEYALAIDRYGDWLHVQEYAPPASIDEQTARNRLEQAMLSLPEVMGIPPQQIILKQRKRQKGSSQYERHNDQTHSLVVTEHGVRSQINLTGYLDTGLFLDHRPMRYWMQQQAKGKKVLNLFCYTGMVSVHAAVGGAAQVDSVDMSGTYLAWAEDNFRLNHFNHLRSAAQYRFIRANAVSWLAEAKSRYDLIFLDPPTFSNSKRMEDVFDVQRDHVQLIRDAMRILEPDGTLVFSNNFRKFKLDAGIETDFQVQDYRLQSLPEDFRRDPKIHGCWLIRHTVQGT